MTIPRRVFVFWFACVLTVAASAAWDTWVLGNLEPDFGDAFGNFGTPVAIFAVLAVPAALCHGMVAYLLRHLEADAPPIRGLITSAVSGVVVMVLLTLTGSLPLPLPAKPLLLPCAIAFLVSLLVLTLASKILSKRHARAA